jgi:hypothetical protein
LPLEKVASNIARAYEPVFKRYIPNYKLDQITGKKGLVLAVHLTYRGLITKKPLILD